MRGCFKNIKIFWKRSCPLVGMLLGKSMTSCQCAQYSAPTVPGGAPLNFSVMAISSTSVKLSWLEPEKQLRNGDIIMYEISYYKTSDPTKTYGLNVTQTNIVIEGLDMKSDYIFQVKAYTSKGAGPWSARLPFQTFGPCKFIVHFHHIHSMTYFGISAYL